MRANLWHSSGGRGGFSLGGGVAIPTLQPLLPQFAQRSRQRSQASIEYFCFEMGGKIRRMAILFAASTSASFRRKYQVRITLRQLARVIREPLGDVQSRAVISECHHLAYSSLTPVAGARERTVAKSGTSSRACARAARTPEGWAFSSFFPFFL